MPLTLRSTRRATAGFARFRTRVNSNVRPGNQRVQQASHLHADPCRPRSRPEDWGRERPQGVRCSKPSSHPYGRLHGCGGLLSGRVPGARLEWPVCGKAQCARPPCPGSCRRLHERRRARVPRSCSKRWRTHLQGRHRSAPSQRQSSRRGSSVMSPRPNNSSKPTPLRGAA